MAGDLVDIKRLKVTAETRAWLQGRSMRSGKSQQEIARDALHDLAVAELDNAKVLAALDPRQGHSRDGGGHKR